MKIYLVTASLSFCLFSCSNQSSQVPVKKETISDTLQRVVTVPQSKKTAIQNGESIQYYESGAIKIRGIMKDGHRNGVWKSWYEDGTTWSETTFNEGKKTGKTTTWYKNGKKRYEGFYTNDVESGKWTYWNDQGKVLTTKDYGIER